MFVVTRFNVNAFRVLSLISIHVTGVLLPTSVLPVAAQNLPLPEVVPQIPPSQVPPPTPPLNAENSPPVLKNAVPPEFSRYILGAGDAINVLVNQKPGDYRLDEGDAISVVVQRFPDLNFQASINSEGNVTAPLLGKIFLKGLTLQQAQNNIRAGFNRYVVNPVVTLSLFSKRQDPNFQAIVNAEGNITIPRLGTVSVQGLSLPEAEEKIRLGLSRIFVDPLVTVALVGERPVQIAIAGEISRPGIYPISPITARVTDALQIAGGSTMKADLRKIQVRRKRLDGSILTTDVDLYAPLQNGASLPNLRLQDGDTIFVPPREIGTDDTYDRRLVARSSLAVPQIKIRVLNYAGGGIATQTLPNGSTFIDVLTGINPENANLRQIALVRFDPERGKAITQRLDAKKALAGDRSQNVPLQDNDVIVVGRNLITRITNTLSLITRPFFDVQNFIRFFDSFGGGF